MGKRSRLRMTGLDERGRELRHIERLKREEDLKKRMEEIIKEETVERFIRSMRKIPMPAILEVPVELTNFKD